MAYTFQKSGDNVQVSQDGKVISTTTPQNASTSFGYVDPTANAPKPVAEVGVVSSQQGVDTINQKTKQLSNLTPVPVTTPAIDTTKTTTTDTAAAPSPTKITLLNPTTGQTSIFEDASVNKENIQNLMKGGYQISETSGNLPSWLVSSQTGTTDTPQSKAQQEVDQASTDLKSLTDSLSKYTISDADLKAQTDAITTQWDARIADMQKVNSSRIGNINTTGIRLGSQYAGGAGGVFGGIVSEEERQSISRIGELEGNKQSAIAAAKSAAAQQNWQVYSKQVDLAQKAYEDKITALKELNTATTAQNKLISDNIKDQQKTYYDQVTKPKDDILVALGKSMNAVPQSVIDAVNNSEDLASAVSAAGTYLQDVPTSGIVGEYLFYKKQAEQAGHTPVSFNDYQNMDANRKAVATNKNDATRVLSATEAQALQVPFGTTAGEAYGKMVTKAPTENQSKDAAFAARVIQSDPTINNLADKISKMGSLSYQTQITAEPTAIGNGFVSDEIRQIRQAERNFLNSVLRRESGAAISPSEFAEGNKQYFPQPGDDATTLANKAENRKIQIKSLSQSAGPALADMISNTGTDLIAQENNAKSSVLNFVTNNATTQPEAANTVKSLKSSGKTYSEILDYLKLQPYYK